MQDDIDMEPLHKLFIYRKKLVKRMFFQTMAKVVKFRFIVNKKRKL